MDKEHISKEELESCEAVVIESVEKAAEKQIDSEEVMWTSYRQVLLGTLKEISVDSPSNHCNFNTGRKDSK